MNNLVFVTAQMVSGGRKPSELLLVFLIFIVFSSVAYAQGPIGPVGPDTGPATPRTDTGTQKPPVDLPYKPTVEEPLPDSRPDRATEVIQKEIPYIPSKSPEPLGAPDPEIN